MIPVKLRTIIIYGNKHPNIELMVFVFDIDVVIQWDKRESMLVMLKYL